MTINDLNLLNEFNLNEEIKEKFIKFYNLLIEENNKYNLTSILDEKEIIEKHFFDSLSIMRFVNFDGKSALDIGTGAGFPGIPLALTNKNAKFYLLEASKKKCNFLELAIKILDLKNVIIINARCEELSKEYRDFFDITLSRAVSELRIISELALPFTKVDGHFFAYKGINYKSEIDTSESILKSLDSTISNIFEYHLELSKQNRFIIDIKKNEKTNIKYPRQYSKILKNN